MYLCWFAWVSELVFIKNTMQRTFLLRLQLHVLQTWLAQQTRDIDPMLNQRWSTVYDAGSTLSQHWVDVSCFLGQFRRNRWMLCRHIAGTVHFPLPSNNDADTDAATVAMVTFPGERELWSDEITLRHWQSAESQYVVPAFSQRLLNSSSTSTCLTLLARGSTLSDVYRCQIMTSKVDPRTERIKYLIWT